jgi:Ca2+-transporting ATPase
MMRQPPRSPAEGIFAGGMGFQVAWAACLMAAVTLGVQAWGLASSRPSWQTMVFTVLCLSQLANALAVRSERASLRQLGLFTNAALLAAVAGVAALQMAVIYAPPLARVFGTVPLTLPELALAVAASTVIFFAIELEKMIRRRRA